METTLTINITHFFSDGVPEYNSANWRTMIPTRALRRAGHTVALLPIHSWLDDSMDARRACAMSDLIILQRVFIDSSIDRALFWKARDKAVVCDIDDAYQLIQDDNQAHKFWGLGEVEILGPYGLKLNKTLDKHPVQQFAESLSKINGLTMPSRILADDWRWAGKCWYVPNYVDSDRYVKWRTCASPDPDWITIGYGASLSHTPSFELSGFLDAIQKVVLQRPRVRVLLCGDRRLFDLVPISNRRKFHLPYVRWDEWPRILGMFDIGIAPMARRYDDSRSWIKAVESSIMGTPFVATRSPAYQDFINLGVGRYVDGGHDDENRPKRAEQWESVLLDMVDHLSDYKDEIRSRYAQCYELTDIDYNVSKVISTYTQILEKG